MTMGTAKLVLDGQEYELPVITGSEGERAVDITSLRSEADIITLDSGYGNTGSCESAITFINGEEGILRYRGYPIEQLAESATFPEISYLLIYGELPNQEQLSNFRQQLTFHSMIHEDMKKFFEGFRPSAHPMAILSAMVASMSTYYPELDEDDDMNVIRLLAKAKTIAAYAYKKSIGQPFIYPRDDLSYCANFLHMMFAMPTTTYDVPPELANALNMLLILHADHEQNCSTSTVRMVASSQANFFASISAGIGALSGPLHGGANQKVLEMLEMIQQDGGDYMKYVNLAKDKDDEFRLMGFGHRVYKNFDPRATFLRKAADDVIKTMGINDPLLNIAKGLEEVALSDEYFIERKLYPNVDFYSGILYRAMGIPPAMFTVMFALGRLPGWIAHWKELRQDPGSRINRPRQVYTGPNERTYVPMDQR
ncbi:Citrate synthase 1 [Symmachiella dynata]|uniref:Citrate synthase n=2 Tax=Symmachiella dynata TaxID=2527995 RepID=A0A517ZGK5_9PLAN|nr:Citrate synthase 1 [Symmachiella dynata]QDU41604.1 Citrate synthase 1 [Symmachiella dynata]|tara:strand:- start:45 stop:1319 length:1275 start_codon:yes stop_codon:yes gene_type:complete